MLWRGLRNQRLWQVPANDESQPHRAGQWHFHGRTYHRLRVRSMPLPDPHDNRTRPSILVEYAGRVVLIDTTPDFRTQALREGIRRLTQSSTPTHTRTISSGWTTYGR